VLEAWPGKPGFDRHLIVRIWGDERCQNRKHNYRCQRRGTHDKCSREAASAAAQWALTISRYVRDVSR
jgi:hypothetical protein